MMNPLLSLKVLLGCLVLHSVSSCSTDSDCSLLGICNGNALCECFPGWIGATCSQLDLVDAPIESSNGYNVPNTSSWGAGVLLDSSTGLYHMLVAEFVNHCGLLSWHNNSRVLHAISTVATGPYTFLEEAIPVYSHNPSIARTHDGEGYILMHIGGGIPNGVQGVCTNGSSQSGNITSSGGTHFKGPRDVEAGSSGSGAVGTLCAASLTSPLSACNWTGPETGYTNPTLSVDPSTGDILVGGNVNYSLGLTHGSNCGNYGCTNWTATVQVTPNRTGEDPWIWYTPHGGGSWHALFHDMAPDLPAGRHAYSRDGVAWTLTDELAYNATVFFADGSNVTYLKRERPHLLLNETTGDPLVLFTGVMQYSEHEDDHSWTLAQPLRGVA